MKVTVTEIKKLSVKEYLDKIILYLRDIIFDLQKFGAWKVQWAMAINFISLEDVDEECIKHSKSDNKEFKTYDYVTDIVDELSKTFLSRYQGNLETSIRGSDFIFNSVQVLYFKFHRIDLRRGGSHIDSPDCIKRKKQQ